MRGGSFLKRPVTIPATELEAAMALRATRNADELQSVWWRDAEAHTGAARERLQDLYAEQLRRFGALAP